MHPSVHFINRFIQLLVSQYLNSSTEDNIINGYGGLRAIITRQAAFRKTNVSLKKNPPRKLQNKKQRNIKRRLYQINLIKEKSKSETINGMKKHYQTL